MEVDGSRRYDGRNIPDSAEYHQINVKVHYLTDINTRDVIMIT